MHVIDLVLQGVRRFGESRKFPVKPGFNVVFGPTETGKTTLVECLLDLLYPDRGIDAENPLLSWGEPAASRAGLTLSSGREIYRILKDYKTGKISLTQYSPASQKFEPMAADPVQAAAMLTTALELPPFESFYYLFVAAARRMPSTLMAGAADDPAQAATRMGVPQGMLSGSGLQPGMASGPGLPPGMLSAPGSAPGMMGMPGMMPGMSAGPMMPGMAPGMPMAPGMMPGMMPPLVPGMGGMMMPGMMPPGMAAGPDDGMTPEEREQKLVQLRGELKDAEAVDKLQFELDGIQQKIFEIENKKKSASQFDEWLEQAKSQLDRYPSLRRLPENIDARIDNFKNLDSQRANEIEKFDNQALDHDEELRNINLTPPLWNQMLARVGGGLLLGGVIIFVLAPMFGFASLKFLGFLSIPGALISAYVGWNFIAQMTRKGELEKILADIEEKKQASMKRYEIEMAVIEKMMSDTDSDAIDELKGKLQKWRALDENYRSRLERKKKLEKELDLPKLDREEKELRAEIKKLEQELKKYPAFSMDINTMRKEIKKLEETIKRLNPQSSALTDTVGFGVPDLGGAGAVPPLGVAVAAETPAAAPRRRSGPTNAIELYESLLQAASTLFGIDRNQLLASVQARFNLYVQAFFAKRYSEGRIDPDGSIALKQAEGAGRWLDFDQLSPAARDTCYVALQISLLEQATQKRLLPILLDNPYAGLDDAAATLAAKAMKRLAERTQVILLTSQKGPIQLADNSLSLV